MNTIKTLKNIIAVLAITFFMTSCNTLRIATDTITHGERVIVTTDQDIFNYDEATISLALGEKINGRDTLMGLLIVFDSDINKPVFNVGDKMVFTLADNKTITLTNLYDKEFESETTTSVTERPVSSFDYYYTYDPIYGGVYLTPATVTRFVPEVTVRTTRRSYALYPISKSELMSIINKGVTNIMVESDYSDMTTQSSENVSLLLADMLGLLRAEVKANKK